MRSKITLFGSVFSVVLCFTVPGANVAALAETTSSDSANSEAHDVFELIAERLSLMKSVAAWKHARGISVEQSARELAVAESAAATAADAGIDYTSTKLFFEAQNEAAKDVQICWIARWEKGDAQPPATARRFLLTVRPEISEIDAALVEGIEKAVKSEVSFDDSVTADFDATVDADCLSDAKRDAVFESLGQVSVAK